MTAAPKAILPVLIIAIALIGLAVLLRLSNFRQQLSITPQNNAANISSYEDCVAAGYPVLESYPERCMTPDGHSFTRDIGNELQFTDLIRVDRPRPGEIVASPLSVSGQARGIWYFEANFPVQLLDGEGNTLTTVPAQADGDWMTEGFVPFTAKLIFQAPKTATGTLILMKDNPSGLPEHDAQIGIPVRFATGTGE